MIARLTATLAAFCLAFAGLVTITVAPAFAGCGLQEGAPSTGSVETTRSGDFYSARLDFTLTQEEWDVTRCGGEFLEIDFALSGFDLPPEWEDYWVNTDLPGGEHDLAVQDPEPRPAVTGIRVDDLQPGQWYYATITWQADAVAEPYVMLSWTPSHWASPVGNPAEMGPCLAHGGRAGGCVFGNGEESVSMHNDYFPGSGGSLGFGLHGRYYEVRR